MREPGADVLVFSRGKDDVAISVISVGGRSVCAQRGAAALYTPYLGQGTLLEGLSVEVPAGDGGAEHSHVPGARWASWWRLRINDDLAMRLGWWLWSWADIGRRRFS
jgi:hypothetical protein